MAIDVLIYDAYGTLWDVHSVMKLCERCWPGKGMAVSQVWRTKQLEATWLRSLMGRYVPFSTVTREALEYACDALRLSLQKDHESELMAQYQRLAPDASLATWVVRGFGTAVMHGGVTATFAMMSLVMTERASRAGYAAFLPALALAIVLHAAYNVLVARPLVATLAVIVVLPALMAFVFQRSERAVGRWLGRGFDADTAISIGAGCLLIDAFRESNREKARAATEAAQTEKK